MENNLDLKELNTIYAEWVLSSRFLAQSKQQQKNVPMNYSFKQTHFLILRRTKCAPILQLKASIRVNDKKTTVSINNNNIKTTLKSRESEIVVTTRDALEKPN